MHAWLIYCQSNVTILAKALNITTICHCIMFNRLEDNYKKKISTCGQFIYSNFYASNLIHLHFTVPILRISVILLYPYTSIPPYFYIPLCCFTLFKSRFSALSESMIHNVTQFLHSPSFLMMKNQHFSQIFVE